MLVPSLVPSVGLLNISSSQLVPLSAITEPAVNRRPSLYIGMRNGGGNANQPNWVTIGGVQARRVEGDLAGLSQLRLAGATWEILEEDIPDLVLNVGGTGYPVVMDGQNGSVRTLLFYIVQDTDQTRINDSKNLYIQTGASDLPLDRAIDSFSMFFAYQSVASALNLTNPPRVSTVTDSAGSGMISIGYGTDSYRSVSSSYGTSTQIRAGHVINYRPVMVSTIDSVNGNDTVNGGSIGNEAVVDVESETITTAAIDTLPLTNVIDNGLGLVTFDVPDPIHGNKYPLVSYYDEDLAAVVPVYRDLLLFGATSTLITSVRFDPLVQYSAVKVKNANPNIATRFSGATVDVPVDGDMFGFITADISIGADGRITSPNAKVTTAYHWIASSRIIKIYSLTINNASEIVDSTPSPFTLILASGNPASVNINSVYETVPFAVSGVSGGVDIPVTATNLQYAVDTGSGYGAWTSATTDVQLNWLIKARLTSSNAFNTDVTGTLDLGGVSDSITITTRPEDTVPDQLEFEDTIDAVAGSVVESETQVVSGLESGFSGALVVTNGEASYFRGGSWSSWGTNVTLQNGDILKLRTTALSTGTKIVSATFSGTTFDWSVTTTTAYVTNLLLSSNQQILALINHDNPLADLTLADVTFGTPTINIGPNPGNTNLSVSGAVNSGYLGNILINYNRLDLAEFELRGTPELIVAPDATIEDVIAIFNSYYGCNLGPDDYNENNPVPAPDEDGEIITITAKSSSLVYRGSIDVNLVVSGTPLNATITNVSLSGLIFPM